MEVSVPGDGLQSRTVRHAVQRNATERLALNSQQRNLEIQKRNARAQMSKEEREIRLKLKELQGEQRLMEENHDEDYDYQSEVCSVAGDNLDDFDLYSTDDVVNPYPVIFPNKDGTSHARTPRHGFPISGPRRSYPTDDLELLSSSGKPLPAVRSPTRGLISADSIPAAQSSTNLSSVTSVFSSSPGEGSGAIGVWVGDPEAISSVRRPRKSVSRQRLEHQWNRSQSLKERPSSSRSELSVRSSVSRSHSMRENARRSPQTARGEVAGVNDPKRKVSRSRSLKDGGAEKIEECLSAIDLGASYPTSGIKRQMSLRMLSRREMKSGLVENPESKSRVWAYLISEPPTTDPSSSTIAMRRRKLTGTHMKINPTISLEKTSPLPPISPGHLTAGPAYDTDRFSSGESAQSTPPRSPKDLVHVTPSSTPERKLSDQLIPPRVSRTGSLKGSSGSTRTRKLGVSMASGSALLGPDTVSSRRDDPETNRDPGPEKEREISVCVTGSEEG